MHPCYDMSEFPSFLKLNDIPLDVSTTCCLTVDVHGCLGCFCLLAIVNIVAMNIFVQISVQVPALRSLGLHSAEELLDHVGIVCLIS